MHWTTLHQNFQDWQFIDEEMINLTDWYSFCSRLREVGMALNFVTNQQKYAYPIFIHHTNISQQTAKLQH